MPEVVNMQAGRYYRELATAGVLHDWTGDPILDDFTTAGLTANADMAQTGKHPKGLPTSVSALPMLYNKKIFADNGIAVPTTWSELTAAADKLQAAGVTPIELPFGDASQALLTFDMVGVSVNPVDYGAKVDFTKAYPEVAKKLIQLKRYGQADPFGTDYDAATRAFAAGDVAMYPQGIWALAPLQQANPDLQVGAFAFPATDAADDRLITSVDTYIGMSASIDGAKASAAKKFISFLFSKKAHEQYVNDQYLFPVIKGVTSDKPIVNDLQEDYVDTGKVGFYPEELFQSASDVGATVQRFLRNGDQKTFLEALNSAYAAK
jgi:raffinose/stachyose/melibiose transport system substrate-binding protein